MKDAIQVVFDKRPTSSCIISLKTPRQDSVLHHTNGQIIKAMLKQAFENKKNIIFVDHSNMLRNGNANLLCDDKYHLSNNGISQLSAYLKRGIHSAFNIPLPTDRDDQDRATAEVVVAVVEVTNHNLFKNALFM